MNKKHEIIREGIFVTIGSFLALAIAFMLYFMVFMLLETMANQDGTYGFVSRLRIGYAIIWIVFCLIIYRTRVSELLKASILAGSLTTFMIGIGVQLNETGIIAGLVMFLISVIGMFLLHRMKKKWYHYYAIAISIIASFFYL